MQQTRQVRLFIGEYTDEFLEVGDTSASKKLEQLVVAVTWLWNVDKMVSLRPRDTSGLGKFDEKSTIGVDAIQQMNKTVCQLAPLSFSQRSSVTEISSDICASINVRGELLFLCTPVAFGDEENHQAFT